MMDEDILEDPSAGGSGSMNADPIKSPDVDDQLPSGVVRLESPSAQMSKNKLKKLAKKQKWEEIKKLRRENTKAKRKKYRQKVKDGLVPDYISRKEKKSNCMKNSECRVGVAVDMSFNDLMIEKDMAKCVKQVHRCYSINRKQKNPLQYFVTSFGGVAQDAIRKHLGWEHWDVNFTQQSFMELDKYPRDKLVYLTSESENVLTEVKQDYLYIIGGLVDHNSQKGLCHAVATQKGISHARLPIPEYLDMKTRKVLTIVSVFEILLKVSQNIPWDEALLSTIAPRKMAQAKTKQDEETNS